MLFRNRWKSAYSAFFEAFSLADAHYKDAPLYKKIGTAVCYRVFKAYLYGALGLVRMQESAFDDAIRQFTKGLTLCPHDALLQRLVLANLQLGFISEAHRYLRLLHNPPITNDSLIFSLGYDIHVPSSEIYSLEAILYMHVHDIDRAIVSCLAGMSLLAEEVRASSSSSSSSSDTSHTCSTGTNVEGPRIPNIGQGDSPQQTAFQKRLCVHCLALCEAMRMAAEMGRSTPYLVTGSLELALKSLFSSIPDGVVEGDRILDFGLLSSLAFMAFLDNGGDSTLPGRGVTLPTMLVSVFSTSFKCTTDICAIPLKITPFLSPNLFTDAMWAELASYSETYKKAVINHGVTLLDKRYLVIHSSVLSRYIEKMYGLHPSMAPMANNQEATCSGTLQSDTHSRTAKDTKTRQRSVVAPITKAATTHHAITSKSDPNNNSLKSINLSAKSSTGKKRATREKVTNIKQVMNRFEAGSTGLESSTVPIVVKSTKEHREGLSFLPHSDAKVANSIKEIDNATQIALEKLIIMDGTAQISPKVHNLYTSKVSTCHECSYGTPTFATRKLRDDEDRESVINLHSQVKATDVFRDISLGGVYKSQLEKSMTGTLRERMFIELTLEKVEKDGLEDFSFLKAENLHLINRNILFDGSIATSNLHMSKKKPEASSLRDSMAPSLLQPLPDVQSQSERGNNRAVQSRVTPSTISVRSQKELLHNKAISETTVQNNELTDVSTYVDDLSLDDSFVQCPSVASHLTTEPNQTHTSTLNKKSSPLRPIPTKYIQKLVANSSKKASISRNAAYQQLKEENRLGVTSEDTGTRSSDDLNPDELAKQRCKLYMLNNSASTSPSPSPDLIWAAGGPINEGCPQIIASHTLRSETAVLAESILSGKGTSKEFLQLDDIPTKALEPPFAKDSTKYGSNLTALKYPIRYTDLEENMFPSLVHQEHFSPSARASLKYAKDDFHGSRVNSQGAVGFNTLTQQPLENFGYLIESLHTRDASNTTVPDLRASTIAEPSMVISTTRLPYSDSLLLKVELDKSTKGSEGTSLPTYKGIMHVSVRLGNTSKESTSYPSESVSTVPRDITNYNLALVDDESLAVEEKGQPISCSNDTMTLTSESFDTTESLLSASGHPTNAATAEKPTPRADPAQIFNGYSNHNIEDIGDNINTAITRSFKASLNSLRTLIFSDISEVRVHPDRGTDGVASLMPTLETFTATLQSVRRSSSMSLDPAPPEHKVQNVPRMIRSKRKTVPLNAVLNRNTTDMIEAKISRTKTTSTSGIRPSRIQKSGEIGRGRY